MKQLPRTYTGSEPFPSINCWICEELLTEIDKHRDHSDAAYKFLGFRHSNCNLRRCTVGFIPINHHNLSFREIYFVRKSWNLVSKGSKIQVILVTDEKCILSVGIKVAAHSDRWGVEKDANVCGILPFQGVSFGKVSA